MCVICTSEKGCQQPSSNLIRAMFRANPDGAGYMVARGGRVEIHKGFRTVTAFLSALRAEAFTADDPVVYHFRIATQAGRTPEMTHPFPLCSDLAAMERLECAADIGVAHNGIISITSDGDSRYSDTAKFIVQYLVHIVRDPADLRNEACMEIIDALAHSRFALMDGSGYIAYAGRGWTMDDNGLWYSNRNHEFTARHVKAPAQRITDVEDSGNNYISHCNFRWPAALGSDKKSHSGT